MVTKLSPTPRTDSTGTLGSRVLQAKIRKARATRRRGREIRRRSLWNVCLLATGFLAIFISPTLVKATVGLNGTDKNDVTSYGSVATISNLEAAVSTGSPSDRSALSEYEAIGSSDNDNGHPGPNWTRDGIIGMLGLVAECIAVILEIKWRPIRRLLGAFQRWFSRDCRGKPEDIEAQRYPVTDEHRRAFASMTQYTEDIQDQLGQEQVVWQGLHNLSENHALADGIPFTNGPYYYPISTAAYDSSA